MGIIGCCNFCSRLSCLTVGGMAGVVPAAAPYVSFAPLLLLALSSCSHAELEREAKRNDSLLGVIRSQKEQIVNLKNDLNICRIKGERDDQNYDNEITLLATYCDSLEREVRRLKKLNGLGYGRNAGACYGEEEEDDDDGLDRD